MRVYNKNGFSFPVVTFSFWLTSFSFAICAKVHVSYYTNTRSETEFSKIVLDAQKVIIHLKHIKKCALETIFCERCTLQTHLLLRSFPILLRSFPIYQYFRYRTPLNDFTGINLPGRHMWGEAAGLFVFDIMRELRGSNQKFRTWESYFAWMLSSNAKFHIITSYVYHFGIINWAEMGFLSDFMGI
jgi:hypothetical protein